MASTKTQKQELAFQEYKNTYNMALDFSSYVQFEKSSSTVSKGLFTAQSFEKKVLLERVKDISSDKIKKQFLKDYKNGFEKAGDWNLDTIRVKDKSVTCSKWGYPKDDQEVLISIGGSLSPYKTLYNKKNGRPLMKVYKVNWNAFNGSKPQFVFVSNLYGVHFRRASTFLTSFVESAALRKQFEIKD